MAGEVVEDDDVPGLRVEASCIST